MPDETGRRTKPDDSAPTPDLPENGNGRETPAADDTAALATAIEHLRDKYLRAAAEAENVRRRAERDVADARAYGIAGFALDVLSVADNLDRALAAVEPPARETAEGTLKGLLEGVELTRREFQKTLEKHGVRLIDPAGEKFDPNFHEAMFEMPDADIPAGNVAQVIQTGYAIGDRILRPARVGVAKGGPKSAPDTDGND